MIKAGFITIVGDFSLIFCLFYVDFTSLGAEDPLYRPGFNWEKFQLVTRYQQTHWESGTLQWITQLTWRHCKMALPSTASVLMKFTIEFSKALMFSVHVWVHSQLPLVDCGYRDAVNSRLHMPEHTQTAFHLLHFSSFNVVEITHRPPFSCISEVLHKSSVFV